MILLWPVAARPARRPPSVPPGWGAKVLLVEATGCLGGMGTSGLVTAFDPMADGERMLVGGFMREVVETMYTREFLKPEIDPNTWRKNYHHWTPFQVEGYKLVLDEFVTRGRGRGPLLHPGHRCRRRLRNRATCRASCCRTSKGYRFVRPKTYIDATGDAVLADLCGAACREAGRDTPAPMPATLCSLHAGIDWSRDRANQRGRLEEGVGRRSFHSARQAFARHESSQSDRRDISTAAHLFRMNALKCKDLSDGVMLGRRIVQEYRRLLPQVRFRLREHAARDDRLV